MVSREKPASIWNFIEKYKASIILGLAGLILVGLGLSIPKLNLFKPEPTFETASRSEANKESNVEKIFVDVSGAVKKPDLYEIEEGGRVADAIAVAGGFSSRADKNWVAKNLNLAQLIGDGTKIYIPSIGEIASSSTSGGSSLGLASSTSNTPSGKVNINTASASELDTLPRIGPVTAQKIIDGRPYSSVDDLLNKKVLGPKTFEGVKDLVSVN